MLLSNKEVKLYCYIVCVFTMLHHEKSVLIGRIFHEIIGSLDLCLFMQGNWILRE